MFTFSIKQLLRQPGKALLFFLLMAASTALLVVGLVMTIENTRRIQVVEERYTTVGYIEQLPVSVESKMTSDPCYGVGVKTTEDYGGTVLPEDLLFPGANYIIEPEFRPYYVSYLPELSPTKNHRYLKRHVLEFTPLEDSPDGHLVEVRVTKVLFSSLGPANLAQVSTGSNEREMQVGDVFPLCQECGTDHPCPLKKGERYVSTISYYHNAGGCPTHGEEYGTYVAPCSSQCDARGNVLPSQWFSQGRVTADGEALTRRDALIPVEGEDFYEEGRPGYRYVQWAQLYEKEDNTFTTLPTDSLEVLADWHEGTGKVEAGRAITPEEFESGAAVCMMPLQLATVNQLRVGDKVNLAFLCSYYGDTSWLGYQGSLPYDFSLFNAQGEWYQPFWQQEYEIVGIYNDYLPGIWVDTFIIPANSVGAGDGDNIATVDHMSRYVASFQIPNGTIAEFDAAFQAAVPRAENLKVTYDDRGYTEIMKSLRNSRSMALLLMLAGALAALAIVALLLYFFVVKEKKRTAVERSLGMTKGQCRVSLLAGLMALSLLAAGLGSLAGIGALGLAREEAQPAAPAEQETADELDSRYAYDLRYSPWADSRELAEGAEIEVERPVAVCVAAPLGLSLLVLALALALMSRSFRTDPIYLLSTRGKG